MAEENTNGDNLKTAIRRELKAIAQTAVQQITGKGYTPDEKTLIIKDGNKTVVLQDHGLYCEKCGKSVMCRIS